MLPLTAEQSKTTEQIQDNLRHLRNVLTVIQAEYPSLQGSMLAVGSNALHIIAPQDNIEDLAEDLAAIAYDAYQGLGVLETTLISGKSVILTLEIEV